MHYTAKGGRETAHEVDRLGDGGLHVVSGTVKGIDRGARTIAIETGKGATETFYLTADSARSTATGTDKAATVTAYYVDDAGRKTIHVIERTF